VAGSLLVGSPGSIGGVGGGDGGGGDLLSLWPLGPIPCSVVPHHQLLAPMIHPASSGLQSWWWVSFPGVGLTGSQLWWGVPVVLLFWLSIIVLSLSVVILLSTLQAVACSGGIGVLS
jgi:hypothetical protein